MIAAPSQRDPGRPEGVGQLDLIDVDVSPVARVLIDDLDVRRLSVQVADIPAGPFHRVGALARGRADSLSVDLQVDTSLVWMIPPADQEIQVIAVEREWGRGQLALWAITAAPGIDQPLALKAPQMLLWPDRSGAGACAEGLARGRPGTIRFAVEVGQDDRRSRGSRRRFRGRLGKTIEQQCSWLLPDHVAPEAIGGLPGIEAYGVFEPASNFNFDRLLRHILDPVDQDRRRQARIVGVQRYERGERLKCNLNGQGGVTVVDVADRVLSAKANVGESCAVKRANLVRLPALDPHREPLVERRLRSHRVGVMSLAGVIDPVENIPVPELAVATQVELPRADSADGHADQRQTRAAIDRSLTAVE